MNNLTLNTNGIVSVSELTKKFKEVAATAKRLGEIFVFNNNKPSFVLMSIEQYQEYTTLRERCEDEMDQAIIRTRINENNFISSDEFEKKTGIKIE